jgi:hypothetical protein
MELRLQDPDGKDICVLDKDDAMLGAYPVVDFLVRVRAVHPRFPLTPRGRAVHVWCWLPVGRLGLDQCAAVVLPPLSRSLTASSLA